MAKRAPKKFDVDPLILQLFPSTIRNTDLKKAQIVQAIIDIVSQEGFEGLSFDRIGKQSGMAKSHVVYHFQTKNEMLLKAYQYILSYAQAAIIEAIGQAEPGFDRFEAYVRAQFQWMKAKSSHFPFILLLYGRSAYDPQIRDFNRLARLAAKKRIKGILLEDSRIDSSRLDNASIFLHEMVTGVLIDLICMYGHQAPEAEKKLKLAAILSESRKYWDSLYK